MERSSDSLLLTGGFTFSHSGLFLQNMREKKKIFVTEYITTEIFTSFPPKKLRASRRSEARPAFPGF